MRTKYLVFIDDANFSSWSFNDHKCFIRNAITFTYEVPNTDICLLPFMLMYRCYNYIQGFIDTFNCNENLLGIMDSFTSCKSKSIYIYYCCNIPGVIPLHDP